MHARGARREEGKENTKPLPNNARFCGEICGSVNLVNFGDYGGKRHGLGQRFGRSRYFSA